jgi:phosphonoacetaldehyde hydrolase
MWTGCLRILFRPTPAESTSCCRASPGNQRLQGQGIKIGSSTGFTRPMVDILEKAAKKQGYVPDASVAGDEVLHGARPRPFMVYRNLDLLDAWPIESVIKIDDTTSGVGEGLNAGCWAVGVARYSNYMNINTLEEEATLSKQEIQQRLEKTREILRQAGAHYVIDSLADIERVIGRQRSPCARRTALSASSKQMAARASTFRPSW